MKQAQGFLTVLAITFFMSSVLFAQDPAVIVTEEGKVGIGVSAPTWDLHVQNAIGAGTVFALDNTSTGGHAWSILSTGIDNDEGPGKYLIRDEKASAVRLTIDTDGKVGIGTTSPEVTLDVRGDIALPTSNRVVFGVETEGIGEWIQNSLSNTSQFGLAFYTNSQERMRIGAVAGNVGIGTAAPTHPLEMGSGAHVTAGGVWTDASSRAYKENIQHLTLDAALAALETLEPVQYNYKVDPEDNHLGFIAEDVPDLVASKNRKGMSPMDVVAVLTKVVQQQQQQIAELKARLDAQQ